MTTESTLRIRRLGRNRIVATADGCDGFKSREHRVIEACGGRYVGRHGGYVLPASKGATLWRLCQAGWDGTVGIAGPVRLLRPNESNHRNEITYSDAKRSLPPCACGSRCRDCDPFAGDVDATLRPPDETPRSVQAVRAAWDGNHEFLRGDRRVRPLDLPSGTYRVEFRGIAGNTATIVRRGPSLADHAEAWAAERGQPVLRRDTPEWQALYAEWHAFAFGGLA